MGYGPIPASVGRRLAADAEWRRLVVDRIGGRTLDFGRRTYRPPPELADFLVARDQVCCYPGCNHPAELSDIDQATPFDEGGTTDPANCGLLCRRHHRLKTCGGWRLERHADGSLSWISATGHRYDTPGPAQQAAA